MKLTYFGTSHGVPFPTRYTTSFLLEVGDNAYIIDAGAPVGNLLLQKDISYTKVKALFNTHFHADHIFGGLEFISLCNWYFKETDLDVFLTEEKAIEDIQKLFVDSGIGLDKERVRMKLVTKSFLYDDGTIKVTVVPTLHLSNQNRPSFAYIVEAEGKKIMFTGDLSPSLEDFPKILYQEHFDYLVTECAHFPAESLEEVIKNVNCDTVAVTHIFPVDKYDKMKEMNSRLNMEIVVPNDGDCIVL